MEEQTGRTERNNGSVKGILFLLLGFMIIAPLFMFILDNLSEIDLLNHEVKLYEKQLDNEYQSLETLNVELAEKNRAIEQYQDIDTSIASTKKEYFALAAKLEKDIIEGTSNKKIAYLTFDDGPYLKSQLFLDVLDEYDVPATFFYLMKNEKTGYEEQNEAYDAIYRRVISSGHTLGNHTATHKLGSSGVYQSVERFMDEIIENRDFIYERYGYLSDIMRFPGGSYTSAKTDDIIVELRKIGYGYVDWNSATGDGSNISMSPQQYRDNVLNNTGGKNILVVLMHDYATNTLYALPEIIKGLRNQGYIFLPLFYDSVMCKK